MIIPLKMNNEQSKLVASVIVNRRVADIANAKLEASKLRLARDFDRLK
jgi:hypothetical protein